MESSRTRAMLVCLAVRHSSASPELHCAFGVLACVGRHGDLDIEGDVLWVNAKHDCVQVASHWIEQNALLVAVVWPTSITIVFLSLAGKFQDGPGDATGGYGAARSSEGKYVRYRTSSRVSRRYPATAACAPM